MTYRTLRKLIRKGKMLCFCRFNLQDKKVSHCYLCEFPIDPRVIHRYDTPMQSCSRLDFVIRKEYQFLKNLFSENEIAQSIHLHSLESYYHALIFTLTAYKNFSSHLDYPVIFAEPEKTK